MVQHDLHNEKEIHLNGRQVTDSDIASLLPDVIQRSEVLQVLSLNDNALTLCNDEPILPPPPIFDDEDKEDDTKADPKGSNSLTIAIGSSNTLSTVELQDNQIAEVGCINLSTALVENKSIKTLKLGGNKIGDEGLKHILTALCTNDDLHIEHLDLMNNLICNDAGSKLAQLVKTNTTLLTLDLSCNSIGDHTIDKLSSALEHNTTLQELNLAFNHITDSGCESLAKSLKKNKTLKKLWINRNPVTDEGIKEFGTVLLEDNLTLEDFWFFPNDESKDEGSEFSLSVKAIMKMLKVMEDRKKNMKG